MLPIITMFYDENSEKLVTVDSELNIFHNTLSFTEVKDGLPCTFQQKDITTPSPRTSKESYSIKKNRYDDLLIICLAPTIYVICLKGDKYFNIYNYIGKGYNVVYLIKYYSLKVICQIMLIL